MKQILVFKDVNYGSSKSSSTLNTATSPEQLADGALAIYGIDPKLNAGMLSLITDAAASSGTLINKSDFKGKKVYLAQGTADGVRLSYVVPVSSRNIKDISGQVYVAGTKGVYDVGYNGTSGSLNAPVLVDRGDEFILKVSDRTKVISGTTLGKTYSGYAISDSSTMYDILSNLGYHIDQDSNRAFDYTIKSNLAGGSALANTATLSVVNGSKSATASAVHGVGVNDWITLSGDTYKVIAVPTTTTMTLDRPYSGATATIANASAIDRGATAPTEVGISLIDKEVNLVLEYSIDGVFKDATVTQTTAPIHSSGRGEDVLKIEERLKPNRGQLDNVPRYKPQPDSYAIAGSNYDLYTIVCGSDLSNSDSMGAGLIAETEINLAFIDAADTAGKNQSDFEDIMTVLYPDFITLF